MIDKKNIIILAGILILVGVVFVAIYNLITPCVPEWECETWGECIKSYQGRECTDKNECGGSEGKPDVVKECNMKCYDGLQNQGEEDEDCGGPCESCEIMLAPAFHKYVITLFVLLILCGVFIVAIYKRGGGNLAAIKDAGIGLKDIKSKIGVLKKGIEIKKIDEDPRLASIMSYIQNGLNSGYRGEYIKHALLKSGWPEKS